MNIPFLYRESAASALHLAQRATTLSDKERLLALAQKWLALADRATVYGRALTPIVTLELAAAEPARSQR
jgi:hypothetical protein